ncbi:hypothetical protein [Sphingomonas sp. SRS2]|uniref:hypothetical protein n=1 Tax=Sphingomonas sp. SRS2 TaxID=133190 RepID=UPI0006184E63|nr:hypothetical protein [Sphingomonas sp. SRS2]KKC24939.1 hypothetical protein WP12_17120 [Sphingomonas sp. SRS2]
MTSIAPHFNYAGDAAVFAGEPLVVVLTLLSEEGGAPIELTGRTFVMAAFRGKTLDVLASVKGEGDGDVAQLAFTGAQTLSMYAAGRATSLRLQIFEALAVDNDGEVLSRSMLSSGALTVLASPALAADATLDVQTNAQPYVAVTIIQAANEVQFVERGAPADLSAFGFPVGAVPAYAVLIALADAEKLQDIRDNIPADINDEVAIRWNAGAPIKPGDAMAEFIQDTLAYSDGQMTALFTAAVASV